MVTENKPCDPDCRESKKAIFGFTYFRPFDGEERYCVGMVWLNARPNSGPDKQKADFAGIPVAQTRIGRYESKQKYHTEGFYLGAKSFTEATPYHQSPQ